ncbi:MAG: aminotransferase class III-fold pyridoxal phosphate-dependent enzyme [bacterium]
MGIIGSNNNREILEEVQRKYRDYLSPSLARLMKFSGYNAVEWTGEGVIVRDLDGNEYLDFAGGYGVFSLGHRHPKVLAAVEDQLKRLPLSAKVFFNKPLADLAELLGTLTPGNLQYSFVCNSGTEAVEGAIKLARMATGRTQILSTVNSFHGKTMGSLSASGRDLFKIPFEPLIPEFLHVPYGDAGALSKVITEHTAAIILEPIQGEGGIIVPPEDYFPAVRKLCDENKILLIADEIQTGLGRTGRLFAVEHWNVVPDIMTLAKALGGGIMPIGAFVGTPAVWEAFKSNPLIHTSTFGGNPLACAAGVAALGVIQEEHLCENAAIQGTFLLSALREVQTRYPDIIAEVRGKGLMVGVEMREEKYGGTVIMEMSKRRVIGVYTLNKPKVIRFEPPLIVNEKQIEQAVSAFESAVRIARENLGERRE